MCSRCARRVQVPFLFEDEGSRIADPPSPDLTIAHDEAVIRRLIAEPELSVTGISYGFWCGRPEFIGTQQDVIIAVKD